MQQFTSGERQRTNDDQELSPPPPLNAHRRTRSHPRRHNSTHATPDITTAPMPPPTSQQHPCHPRRHNSTHKTVMISTILRN
ncbi:hypothetical protein Hamer_G013876 [Homarus americanus]|uniref:Uncharacterized protein n=1 Tax=Homarus americanus TaxID=6706 RepID=A0A8J5N0Q2_HOMAM|nr:hypothetical protein Hamer_G013876 [Homarus americanus]